MTEQWEPIVGEHVWVPRRGGGYGVGHVVGLFQGKVVVYYRGRTLQYRPQELRVVDDAYNHRLREQPR